MLAAAHANIRVTLEYHDKRQWTAQDLGLQTQSRGSPALECRPYESAIYARVISLTTQAQRPGPQDAWIATRAKSRRVHGCFSSQSFWKAGSARRASQAGSSLNSAGVMAAGPLSPPLYGVCNSRVRIEI